MNYTLRLATGSRFAWMPLWFKTTDISLINLNMRKLFTEKTYPDFLTEDKIFT